MEQCLFVLFHAIVEVSGYACVELSVPPKQQIGRERKTSGLCCFPAPRFRPNWALGRTSQPLRKFDSECSEDMEEVSASPRRPRNEAKWRTNAEHTSEMKRLEGTGAGHTGAIGNGLVVRDFAQ